MQRQERQKGSLEVAGERGQMEGILEQEQRNQPSSPPGVFLLPSTEECDFRKKLQIGQGRSDSIYSKDRVGDQPSLVLPEMPSNPLSPYSRFPSFILFWIYVPMVH